MARPRSDIPQRLLRASRKRFLQDGVDGASLRAIAADARTSIGMLYYYYPAKDDLFLAVVEDVYAGLSRDLEEAIAKPGPFDEVIGRAYQRLAKLSDEEFTVLRIVLREAMLSSQRLGRVLRRFQAGHVGAVLRVLAAATIEGRVRDDLPLAALLPCIGGLAISVLLARRVSEALREGKSPPQFPVPDPAAVAQAAAALLSRGIAPWRKRRSAPAS